MAEPFDLPPPPDPTRSVPYERMAYIRKCVHPDAQLAAVESLLAPDTLNENRGDSFIAAVDFGVKAKATSDEIINAFDTEWRQDTEQAAKMLADLRAGVWAQCRAGMPQKVVERTASEVMERWRVWLPDDLLDRLLADVWDAAQPRTGKGKRRYGRKAR